MDKRASQGESMNSGCSIVLIALIRDHGVQFSIGFNFSLKCSQWDAFILLFENKSNAIPMIPFLPFQSGMECGIQGLQQNNNSK